MMDKKQQMVFIVGSGRSGTTLLRNMLERHSDIGVSPELKFFDLTLASFIFPERRFKSIKRHLVDTQLKVMQESNDPKYKVALSYANLRGKLMDTTSLAEMFGAVFLFSTDNRDASVFIEKTPANIHFLKKIFLMFPEAKIIHVVRDGREFCASAMRRGWTQKPTEACALWSEALRSFDIFYSKTSKKSQFLELKYETLVSSPKDVLKTVLDFCDATPPDQEFFNFSALPSFSSFFKKEKAGIYKSSHFKTYFETDTQRKIEILLRNDLRKRCYAVSDDSFLPHHLKIVYFYYRLKLRGLNFIKNIGLFGLYEKIRGGMRHKK